MPNQKRTVDRPQYFRANFDLGTINKEKREVDVVFATEREVMMYNWNVGLINEVLECNDAAGDLSRLNNGAPLCDTHITSSVRNGLGVVKKAWFENGKGRATVAFSKRKDVDDVWQDVVDGMLNGISVRYIVSKYEITEEEGKLPLYRAKKWHATEISLALVQADQDSGVGREEKFTNYEVEIISNKNTNPDIMEKNRSTEIISMVRKAKLDIAFAEELLNDENLTIDQARAKVDAKVLELANKPDPNAGEKATNAERKRNSDILSAVRAAHKASPNLGFDSAYAQTFIDDDKATVDAVRAAIIEKMAAGGTQAKPTDAKNAGSLVVTADETDKRRTGMSNAILVRAGITKDKDKDGKVITIDAGEFRGLDLVELGRECLEAGGNKTRGLSKREIATAALNIDNTRAMSISDFPLVLGNTVNRSLRAAYDLQERTFTGWANRGNAKDFREMARTQLGDLVTLEEVKEGAEYKSASIGEGAEKYRVVKYGKIIPITWETLINDDLDAFGRLPQIMANSAASKQSDIVYAILTANAAMADGVALFHADHGNLLTGSAIDVSKLGLARAAMRKQTSPNGGKLNLTPKFLIVGPDYEQIALQYTSANFVSAKSSDVNVWVGMMQPVVEARVSGNKWYLAANPGAIDTVEYAFLDGEEFFTEQRNGFEVDGVQIKVRMVMGAKAIDHRGLTYNPGA
jgi:hypothetical protein